MQVALLGVCTSILHGIICLIWFDLADPLTEAANKIATLLFWSKHDSGNYFYFDYVYLDEYCPKMQ